MHEFKPLREFETQKDVVIFTSMFEHNANLLPWREVGALIKTIAITKEGDFDY